MPVVTLALVCLLPVKLEASTTQHQVCFAYLRLTASDEAATVQGTMPMLTTANLRACFRQSLEGSAAMTARQRSSTVGIGRQAGKQANPNSNGSSALEFFFPFHLLSLHTSTLDFSLVLPVETPECGVQQPNRSKHPCARAESLDTEEEFGRKPASLQSCRGGLQIASIVRRFRAKRLFAAGLRCRKRKSFRYVRE
ncbi:uncharacterized protein UDID_19101 [Ustilago sp. UG-2017a]|nr:uncharacterized protein UDID_19101 [Ustilago sp. UG-2017a]